MQGNCYYKGGGSTNPADLIYFVVGGHATKVEELVNENNFS